MRGGLLAPPPGTRYRASRKYPTVTGVLHTASPWTTSVSTRTDTRPPTLTVPPSQTLIYRTLRVTRTQYGRRTGATATTITSSSTQTTPGKPCPVIINLTSTPRLNGPVYGRRHGMLIHRTTQTLRLRAARSWSPIGLRDRSRSNRNIAYLGRLTIGRIIGRIKGQIKGRIQGHLSYMSGHLMIVMWDPWLHLPTTNQNGLTDKTDLTQRKFRLLSLSRLLEMLFQCYT